MITDEHLLWVERYRPRKVEDCVLPDELKRPFLEYAKTGQIPNMVLTGRPGMGKTTVARAMCDEAGCEYIIINGSKERGIDTIRTVIQGFAGSVSLTGSGRKVIIVDEAENLTQDAQKSLRGVIEEFETNCSFVFTTNYFEQLIEPLHSRFVIVHFTLKEKDRAKMAGEFFKRVEYILKTEDVKYDRPVVADVVKKFFPDYRRTLHELQHYSVGGTVDVGILSRVKDTSFNEVFGFLKGKNYAALRKWVALNGDSDTTSIMRGIYDRLSENLDPSSVPVAIILLGKYQYQAAFAVDKEINLMAFLTEMLIECQLK
jgi:DNA polymerase III delta prime subunit